MGRPKPPTPMRVLVNNVTSYTGRSIVESLQREGHTVVALGSGDNTTAPDGVEVMEMSAINDGFVENVLSVMRLSTRCPVTH